MEKRNFITIIVVFIILSLGSILMIFGWPKLFSGTTKNEIKITKYEEELNETLMNKYSYKSDDLKKLSLKDKELLLIDEDEYYKKMQDRLNLSESDTGKSIMEDFKIKEFEDKYISYLSSKDFETVVNDYESLRKKYDLTTENGKNLRYIYEAAVTMYNLKGATDFSVMTNFINDFKEPRSYIISILQFPEKYRRGAYIAQDTLSPVSNGDIYISGYTKLANNSKDIIVEDEILKEIYTGTLDNYTVYNFTLTIQGEKLTAYVIQSNRTYECKIYKIISNEKQTNFKRLDELIKLDL